MGVVKQSADLIYAFRFVRLLTTPWEETDAFKLGIIDENGNRNKRVRIDNSKTRDAYTPFIRIAFNIKRLLQKVPGGRSRIGSFAAGLYLIREKYGLSDNHLQKILNKVGVDPLDILSESSQWFVLEDERISPGIYRITNTKVVNSTFEPLVNPKDKIRISENCYPIGNVFGVNVYEATHIATNQKIYITSSEIRK